ncbi:response regulator [Rhizorhabdus argentea]|uniref:response regulator n=1 Tax=Rhizorhabdus argentea TaxID=1387174 RepID=UPI0030EF2AEA
MQNYSILLIDESAAHQRIIAAVIASQGKVDRASTQGAAIEAVRARRYDMILLDERTVSDDEPPVAELRAAAGCEPRVPIIAFTRDRLPDLPPVLARRGFDGALCRDFRVAELAGLVGHWLGPERIASVPPQAGLAGLIGAHEAEAMIARLYAGLSEAVGMIDAGAEARIYGHSLGGLAGSLGLPVLSAAWLTLQEGDYAAWPTVRTLTMEALAGQRQ